MFSPPRCRCGVLLECCLGIVRACPQIATGANESVSQQILDFKSVNTQQCRVVIGPLLRIPLELTDWPGQVIFLA